MKNITTLFIVPTLGISKEILKTFTFKKAYQFDPNSNDVYAFDVVYLLFKPENSYQFGLFIDTEKRRTKFLIDDYDYKDGFVVLVYKLDPKFKKDYDLIKEGKYSKTSEKFKELFPQNIAIEKNKKIEVKTSLQFRVFNKSSELLGYWEKQTGYTFSNEMELWSSQETELETLDLTLIT